MAHVAILSPGYPTGSGGVTDHTARLVRHWEESGHRVSVWNDPTVVPIVLSEPGNGPEITAILIQYVPFLYGRRGLSRLPRQIARAAGRHGIRVSVFVHEPWVPPTRLPWLVLSPLQRRQLRRLVAAVDEAITPVPRWATLLGPATRLLHVGSTLGDPPEGLPSEPVEPAPMVFSPFAAGLAWDWIVAAVDAIGAGLTVVGCDRDAARSHPAVGRYARPDWDYHGRLPATQVLETLARARLVLAPFTDGLTGRRTSAMAALSVGAPLVSSSGPLFDPAFGRGPVTISDSRDDFAHRARELWDSADPGSQREKRIEWFGRQLGSRILDDQLLEIVTGAVR